MGYYSSIEDHRSMVFDQVRNNAYTAALEKTITPESVVLDLGAGFGIHGLVAAKLGARKVYMVDPSPVLRVTQRVARANGFGDQIEFIQESVEQLALTEKVDVIISVFTGNFLLTEDLLPLLFLARDRFLGSDGVLLPDRARMEVAAVSVPDYYKNHIGIWETFSQGLDYGVTRDYAVNSLYYDSADSFSAEFLSKPAQLSELDFFTETEASCRNAVALEVESDGLCHGCLGWFQTRLAEVWLSTSPAAEQTHWSQVFLPLDEPVQVREGEVLRFELHRPESGHWTWTFESRQGRQRHSTFLSAPQQPANLLKQTKDYQVRLSRQGEMVRDVLNSFDGSTANDKIIEKVTEMIPGLSHSPQQIKLLINKLIDRYGE